MASANGKPRPRGDRLILQEPSEAQYMCSCPKPCGNGQGFLRSLPMSHNSLAKVFHKSHLALLRWNNNINNYITGQDVGVSLK